MKIEPYSGRNLSLFRTQHYARNFVRVRTLRDAVDALEYARKKNLNAFVLGAGSNVFFANGNIKSFVIKNELPVAITPVGNGSDLFEVSSSTPMMKLLEFAHAQSRDCCYYLASAPCQIGGAIAMNAGSGPAEGKSISDYVESVTFVKDGQIKTLKAKDLSFGYRTSAFTDSLTRTPAFIVSAVLRLEKKHFDSNPISERLKWAAKNQDLSAPNCGSLCNRYHAPILKFVCAIFRKLPAGLSPKKLNWAYNKTPNYLYLKAVFFAIKVLHFLLRKKLKFEVRIVR